MNINHTFTFKDNERKNKSKIFLLELIIKLNTKK